MKTRILNTEVYTRLVKEASQRAALARTEDLSQFLAGRIDWSVDGCSECGAPLRKNDKGWLCPLCHRRAVSRLRRRVEDALRKTATESDLRAIADLLKVKTD